MIFFGNKKKRNEDIDASFERVMDRIHAIDDWDNPKKIEHYILDSCEHIIGMTKEIEALKAEYRVLTSYLDDILKIQKLPDTDLKELRIVAGQILKLERARNNFLQKPKSITDDQFLMIEENESVMPQVIGRMRDNERYQANCEKNMHILEADRGEIEVDRDEIKSSNRIIRTISILFLVMFFSVFVLLYVLSLSGDVRVRPFMVGTIFAGALIGLFLFAWQSGNRSKSISMGRSLGNTVNMLNISRMKYANVTRAIMYEQQKYGVKSSHELQYIYEKYQETVRSRNQYERDNSDLEYYNGRMMRLLEPVDLYDKRIWLDQAGALHDEEDMKEVRQNLVSRRSRVRDEIAENTRSVKSERDEIDRMMKAHDYYVPEILEIITSVDRICGLRKHL